jgi:hypothetical protein
VGHQRGVIPGAGADVQHAAAGLECQQVDHPRQEARRAVEQLTVGIDRD